MISEGGAKAVLTGPAGTGKHLLAQHVLQAVPADRRGEVKIETWRPGEDKPVRVFLGRG